MDLPDIPIYASKYTLEMIKLQLGYDGIEKANLIEIKPHYRINFGKNSLFPISVTHSIPDCFCYVLNTLDGSVEIFYEFD